MTITTRTGKGSPLTQAELDENFTDLRDGVGGRLYPKTKGVGNKVDSLGTPTYPWHDLQGVIINAATGLNASYNIYQGNVRQFQFEEGQESFLEFHMPHDVLPGGDIFIHAHWSHGSTTLTGGSITWGFEMTYAKGHNQSAFPAPKTVSVLQNASLIQYQHMIAETSASITGGSGTQIDSSLIEPDGLILCRVFLDSNDLTDSVTPPNPYLHGVDIHYQSTGIGTKQKEPDFWT